ncbi:hypothetical protein OG754_00140 [Streptomyces decoyicus]|uniref:hypothetical protein n=1 Tax=Streptomyces decoyicus TaxID=249567 RepID=UPI002E37C800|nr:hypothetical protein [Streptomyces decoyicus]
MGYDLFGDPYFEDDVAVLEPEQLRDFTPQTLPKNLGTWQQIRDVGLEPVGPPVGLLSWTLSGPCAPKTAKVYDMSKARKAVPREPDIFELIKEAEEQELSAAAGGVGRVDPVISQGVLALAAWSEWVALVGAEVPRLPGVYLARRGQNGPMAYVGMSGERQGEGLRGRIRRYSSGKALASGLFELHASQEAAPLYREFGFAGSSALMRMAYLEEPGPGELEGIGCRHGAGPGWVPPEQYAENKPS